MPIGDDPIRQKAKYVVGLIQGTMGLEGQAVDNATLAELEQETYEELCKAKRMTYFRKVAKWLRKEFPVPCRVTVRYCRSSSNGDHAKVDTTKRGVVIEVYQTADEDCDVESLLHEWAHIPEYLLGWDNGEHSSVWGAVYATIYDQWEKDFQVGNQAKD